MDYNEPVSAEAIVRPSFVVFAIACQILALVLLLCQQELPAAAKTIACLLLLGSVSSCFLQARAAVLKYRAFEKLRANASRLAAGEKLENLSGDDQIASINSELSKAQTNLAEALRKENAVVNHANEVICSIGTDHCFLSVNPACRKVWGFSPEEIIGKQLGELVIAEDKESSIGSLIGAQKSVDTLNFENRLRKKSGEIINVLWSAHWSIADKALFCVAHDITERKKAERILAESEARFREIFHNMPIALLIINKKGFIELINPAVTEHYGYTTVDLTGKSISEILDSESTPQLNIDLTTEPLRELIVKSKSGRTFTCQCSSSGLNMSEGPRILLVLVDTTEQKAIEQLKQSFFMMISHDLRSPLTSLMYVFERLKGGKLGTLNDSGIDLVSRNADEAKRLVELVNELLDVEKIRSGELPLSIARCNLKELILSAINAVRGIAASKEISLHYEPSDVIAYIDKSLLTRVVINLLSNAIKFSPEKSTVAVTLSFESASFEITVRDEGRGIPKDLLDYIFEPFKQVSATDHSRLQGSGLGLAICKMIVERHGGTVTVISEPEGGSTFTLSVPTGTATSNPFLK